MTFSLKEQDLISRATVLARGAIGQSKTMRLSKTVTVTGVIKTAEFARFERTARSISVVFRIVMVCGANQVEREFFCKQLPN